LTLPFSLLLQVDHGVIVVHFPKKIIITRYDSNRMLLLKVSQTSFFSHILRGSKGVGFTIESYGKVEISYINVDNF
jgi:hypothetical protein